MSFAAAFVLEQDAFDGQEEQSCVQDSLIYFISFYSIMIIRTDSQNVNDSKRVETEKSPAACQDTQIKAHEVEKRLFLRDN